MEIKTGIAELDEIVRLDKPQLIVLAGRILMGKTTLAIDILTNLACKQRISSLYIDLSITQDRLLESLSKNPDIYERDLKNPTLHIINKPQMSITKLCDKCRQMKKKFNIKFVFIDDLQFIRYDINRCLSANDQFSEISKILKNLAHELDITIFALSQIINRPDKRTDHRPILADLTNNVLVENADVIIFLYRENYYNKSITDNTMELIVAKNETGLTKTIEIYRS